MGPVRDDLLKKLLAKFDCAVPQRGLLGVLGIDQVRRFRTEYRPGWTASGRGPNFFTKPINAVRVRIRSSFSGDGANFIVWCRTPSTSLVVNELIGSGFGNNGTEGVYRMANCTEVEVDTDQNVQWWLSQESGTAFTPPRSWTHVTGTEGDLSVDALAALAKATDIERSVPVQ